MIIPTLFGVISFFLNPQNIKTDGIASINHIEEIQRNAIVDYLTTIKLVWAILVSFFITFRWSTIHKDGSYGYFLTQGINRKRFFGLSVSYFLILSFLFTFLGFLIIIKFGGLSFFLPSLFFFTVTLFSIIIFILSLSILFAQIIKIPELASILSSIVIIANSSFNSNVDSFISRVINPELNILAGNSVLPLITSLVLSTVFVFLGYIFHLKIDVEL